VNFINISTANWDAFKLGTEDMFEAKKDPTSATLGD
jgi:hypothetical protein